MACLESNYQVIQPQGEKINYGKGNVTYNFSVAAPTVWIPSKSFFRCQIEITGPAVARPTIARCLTLAEGAVSNTIQNCSFDAGGVTVSKLSTAAAQIAALKMRRGRSRAWMNSVGASAAGWGGTFSERLAAICGDSNPVGLLGASDTYVESIFRAGAVPEAEVGILTATGVCAVTSGTLTANTVKVGMTLVHTNVKYTVVAVTGTGTTAFTVVPRPPDNVDASTNWYFVQRDTGNSVQGKHIIEVMWQPPLGIMDPSTPPLGGGSFRFDLSIFSDYQNRMAEALSHVAWASPGTDWNIKMDAPDLYLYTAKMAAQPLQIDFPLREYQSYSQVYGTAGNKVVQLTVQRSTARVHLFLQAGTAGSDSTIPSSRFIANDRIDLLLKSVQVTFAGQTKHRTPWKSEFAPGGTNLLTAMYYSSLVENDGKDADEVSVITDEGKSTNFIAPASGGQESILEWSNRGPIWTLEFNRSATGSEVDMTVDIDYSTPPGNNVLFIVSEYTRMCTIKSSANQIVDVAVITN